MVNPDHKFHAVDYAIFGATIVVSLGIGIYHALSGGKQRTTSEFFVGNRKMSVLPVAISLMVSFESSIMMLGTPAEVYVYGLQWFVGKVGFLIANILSIIVVVPLFHPLKITSAYEYLEMRFESHAVRVLGTVLGMLNYTGYMGVVLFGPAIALEGVTGFPQWGSILSVALASIIYTAIGGLKAVIWTDVFQCMVMFAGFFAVLIKGTMFIGGVGKTWEIAYENGRVNIFNFDTDPTIRHTFWSLFIGSIIRGFGLVFNQSSVQRISSTPTLSDAKKVMMFVAPGFFISLTLAGIEGIIAYSYYDTLGCDPLKSGQISNPNQIIPYMVMDIFKGLNGMPGLFMASLFSASLSTLSSGLSSMSALFYTDLIKPHVKPMSELRATVISKISVVVFGGLAMAVAFLVARVGGTLIQITGSILAAFGGPLTGLFMFGAFCPWGNAKGALWGAIIACATTFTIAFGQMTTKGSVKNTRLPSAPIDFCPVINTTLASGLISSTSMPVTLLNGTMGSAIENVTSTTMEFMTSETMMGVISEPTGFRRIFMLSYMWFGVISIMQVIIIGSVISLCTGYKKPGEVDKKFLIPFYDSLFPFLPECLLKPLRCGYHSKETEEIKSEENGKADYIQKLPDDRCFGFELVVEKSEIISTAEVDLDELSSTLIDNEKAQLTMALQNGNNETSVEREDILPDKRGELRSNGNVAKSVDNLWIGKIPVNDMEFEIVKDETE